MKKLFFFRFRAPLLLSALAGVGLLASGWVTGPPASFTEFKRELELQLGALSGQSWTGEAYLMTDKTLYAPGETVWVSVFANRNGLPMSYDNLTVELLDPKGSVSRRYRMRLNANGHGKCDFDLAAGLPGGRYRVRAFPGGLVISDTTKAAAVFSKDLTVQTVTLPRVKLTLDFERKSYGPGDEVTATLKAFGNDNQPLAARPIKWTARVANDSIGAGTVAVAANGNATIRFRLPARVAAADGLLTLTLDHEGLTEAVARAIPIVLNRIRLDLLPEGGELVTGLAGQVALRATNEFGEPADVAGYITDERGVRLTRFRSLHDGLGKFALTPRAGRRYFAHLTAPAGTPDSVVAVPEALVSGFAMQVERQQPGAKNLKVTLASTVAGRVLLVCVQHGKVVYSAVANIGPAAVWLPVPVSELPAGVMQLTLFDAKKLARAERLVMVNADRQLRLSVKTDRTSYGLRQKVKLTIQALDEQGLPAPATLALSVVDDQNLAFAADKQSTIQSWLLAERALRQPLREPSYYFDPKEKDAPAALDLVLLTHGWRRFTWELIRAQNVPAPVDNRPPPLSDSEKDEARAARRSYRDDQAEQVGDDRIAGFVLDHSSENAIPGALVTVRQAGRVKGRARTNAAGYYSVGGLRVGAYDVSFSVNGFHAKQVQVVRLTEAGPRHLNAQLMPHEVNLKETVVTGYRIPIINYGGDATANTLDNAAIMKLPTRDVANLSSTTPGVFQMDAGAGLNLKGSRSSGTVYYVNGVKQLGGKSAPGTLSLPALPASSSPPPPAPIEVRRLEEVLIAQPDLAFTAPSLPAPSLAPDNYEQAQAREFAAPIYPLNAATQTTRTDFRSTLFWKPDVVLDQKGRATLEFYTGDAVTSYRIVTEGTDAFGLIGHAEAKFFTSVPVALSLKLPPYLVSGDTVAVPLVLTNTTDQPVRGPLALNVPADWRLVGSASTATATLAAHSAEAFHLRYVVGSPGSAVSVSAVFGDGGDGAPLDQLFQTVKVLPNGYPMAVAYSGSELTKTVQIDASRVIPGSLQLKFMAFPSGEANMLKGLEAMLQEPHGCFEQTMASTYPNAIVLRYLLQRRGQDNNAQLIARAQANLDHGYARLATFPRPNGGFDWFSHGPGSEVLTAYALARFSDMRQVRPNAVIDRLAGQAYEWLRAHHTRPTETAASTSSDDWRPDPNTANAYVLWGLGETERYSFLTDELGPAADRALFAGDPYQLALLANTNLPEPYRTRVQTKLVAAQETDGSWMGRKMSAVSSTGDALRIETTALAVLAGLREQSRCWPAVQKGVKYLLSKRSAYGGYGSSQSTFLALKALIAFEPYSHQTRENGTVAVFIDGAEAARTSYAAGNREIIEMPDLRSRLTPGKHRLEVRYAGVQTAVPYTLAAEWGTTLPPSSEACAVRLTTTLAPAKARVGESCRLTATLRNTSPDKTQPMPMALIGLPAGLSPQPWQLRELLDRHVVDYYELRDGQLACYFRALAPNQTIVLNLDLKAELPGTFSSPPSVAYLYYTDEHKWWVPAVTGVVKP